MENVAVISDIHGNIPALQAVLLDIKKLGISKILCLGDIVGKGPSSDKAIDICRDECDVIIRGNWDDNIVRDPEYKNNKWHYELLGKERIEFISKLENCIEFTINNKSIRLFHASQIGIYNRVHKNDNEEIQKNMFCNTEFTGYSINPDIIGYGDIHSSYIKYFDDKILFNAGSVGNPLDITKASYAIISSDYITMPNISIRKITYNIELAIHDALIVDMPEKDMYINELKTAIYRNRK